MMVVGLPMLGRMVRGEAVAGTLANGNDEDDHANHPRRGGLGAWAGLVARKFGHRFLGTVIIDERFAGGGCGDESSGGDVVERPRQAQAGLVEAGNRVVSEQRICATDQSQ